MILSSNSLTGVTAKPSVFEDVDFICGTDTNSFPLADKMRIANNSLGTIGIWIWQSVGSWSFDDTNKTTLPTATTDLVNGQRDYSLPTDILAIRRVQIKDSSGNWQKLEMFDEAQVYNGMDNDTAGMPTHYRLEGSSILLYPKPDTSMLTATAGLEVQLDRTFTLFTVASAGVTPGFAEPFHDLLSLLVCKGWFLAKDLNRVPAFDQQIAIKKADLQSYYGGRAKEERPRVRPRYHNYD